MEPSTNLDLVEIVSATSLLSPSKLPISSNHSGDLTSTPAYLPIPEIQLFGGGAHAAGRIDIQDFMLIAVGAQTFGEALEWTAEVYRTAGELLRESGLLAGVADEGGWWPQFSSNEEALEWSVRAIEAAGFKPGQDLAISLDVAASEFGQSGSYCLSRDQRVLNRVEMLELLKNWLKHYPIISLEDPLAEDDDWKAVFQPWEYCSSHW